MIHDATATGATVDEARANAVAALNAPEDADIHTEILAMPTKKVLGLFGGSPAKARAYYETPDAPKPQPVATPFSQPKKQPEKTAAKPQPQKTAEKPAQKAEPAQAPKAEPEKPIERTRVVISESQSLTVAVKYLKDILTGMGVENVGAEAYRTEDNEVTIELDCGDDYGIVIGRRGETLDSIQYLTRLVANKHKAENEYVRISVNVGNYREKRNNTLKELAKKNAEKVLKYGRNVTFEPMNPYERRIIHTTVQEIEGVSSHSVGSDANRRVVITLNDGVKPTHPSRGGYNNNRGGRGNYNNNRGGRGNYNNNRGGRGGYNNDRQSAPRSDAPSRAPRTDAGAQNVSLYGKIN